MSVQIAILLYLSGSIVLQKRLRAESSSEDEDEDDNVVSLASGHLLRKKSAKIL